MGASRRQPAGPKGWGGPRLCAPYLGADRHWVHFCLGWLFSPWPDGPWAVTVHINRVFAQLKCGFMVDKQNAWAAEWLSKMMPVHVATDVLCLTITRVLCIADCSSAVISNKRSNPRPGR